MFILKKFVSSNKNKVLISLLFIGLIFQFVAFKTVGTHPPNGLGLEDTTRKISKPAKKVSGNSKVLLNLEILQKTLKNS